MRKRIILSILGLIVGLFYISSCSNSEEPKTNTSEILLEIVSEVVLPEEAEEDFQLVTSIDGATISWSSSNNDIILIEETNAKVTRQEEDAEVILTATFTLGKYTEVKAYTVKVLAVESGDTGWLPWV